MQGNLETFSLYKSACTSLSVPSEFSNGHSIDQVNTVLCAYKNLEYFRKFYFQKN